MDLRVRPDRETFAAMAAEFPMVPVWAELLSDVSTPVGIFDALAGDGSAVLFESVERSERWGRYSFVAGDPAAVIIADEDGGVRLERVARELPVTAPPPGEHVLDALKRMARELRAPAVEDLPSLTGGFMGMLTYEAAKILDGHPYPTGEEGRLAPIELLIVDRAVVFDQWRQRMLLVAHVPAASESAYDEGVAALEAMARTIASAVPPEPEPVDVGSEDLTPEVNLPDERYTEMVRTMKEHILAGDIFQGVPSRRITFPAGDGGAMPIYRRLRLTNPSPYMFLLRMPDLELAGSSPEPIVRVEGRRVSTRPIAGTRPRGGSDEEDRALEVELLADPKELAEHAMLVDLARNDLGRVCAPGTVEPTELYAVERFSRVMHIVSTVEGDLADGMDALDALAVTFPAGTVTGAPKRRAMEIIAEEEPTPRGPYAGGVGYLTFSGDLDVCLTIRTACVRDGHVSVQAGAGIVADSDPETELAESKAKMSALLPAIAGGTR